MEIFPTTLHGSRVALLPLDSSHVGALCEVASESRATYGLTHVPASREQMEKYVEAALADATRGLCVPFATVDLARERLAEKSPPGESERLRSGAREVEVGQFFGTIVGTTRFGNLERWTWPEPPTDPRPAGLDAVEIGWTWLAASAQRSHVNTAAKLLMLTQAFEVWRVRRVNLRTDARNFRSRKAIERIGGKLDGVLRAHMPAWDRTLRDTATFSILESEWPAAKARLQSMH